VVVMVLSKALKLAALACLTSFSVIFFSYHLAYAQKVIPGVVVAGIKIGNRSPAEVQQILQSRVSSVTKRSIRFTYQDNTYTFTLDELGVGYDLGQTIQDALRVGRSGNIFRDLREEVIVWFRGKEIVPVLKINDEKFQSALATITDELDSKAQEAQFAFDDHGALIIKEASPGRVVDQERLKKELQDNLESFSNEEITIALKDIPPRLTAADLEAVKPQVEKAVANPPRLEFKRQTWQPAAAEVLDFIALKKDAGKVSVAVNRGAIEAYVQKIAAQVNREPRGEIFKLDGERVVEFRLAQNGVRLNVDEAADLLAAALFDDSADAITLSAKIAQPEHSANDYGINTLLGRGVSNFAGSSAGRIHNIQTAAARLRGILVAPGETFSFNSSVGEISAATGYDQAYIISKGRTILGTGGGVCQVSTTVFRAAFNSGLEILKRTAHAYRVHYYEPPIGFDATVYSPAPDFVFKNDTANYVLIWSYVDVPNTTLTFEIYGTSDGRTTEMIGPFVSNETPPPAPLYQEDPTLPKGTTKQIDWAAWGATATLGRKVYRNGELLHDDTFYSNFKPWQAVFLVGTRS
jgi:vancomycin resistance protein YoaR